MFENMFKMLKCSPAENLKYHVLLDFPLSSGTTRAVFTKSGKVLCSILELIDLVKCGVTKTIATSISFERMVSISVAFLKFNPCISFFTFFTILFTK